MKRRRAGRRKTRREQQLHDATIKAVDEFCIEVAQTLDLPPKELPPPPPSPPRPPPPPRKTREEVLRAIRAKPALLRQREWWLPVVAVLLLIVTGAYAWWPTGTATVPEGFRGTWVSRDSSYTGRMIVISMETIEIVAGRSEATGPLAVTSAKVDTLAEGVRLRVVYGPAGGEQKMEMMLRRGPPAVLTLRRPSDVVWERHEGASALRSAAAAAADR